MGNSRYIYHRLFGVFTKSCTGGIWRATNLGFEAKLWQAANARRNNMDAAE
jgi:hypothetical protein